MNQVGHFLRKDLRRYWPGLVLANSLWAANLWCGLQFYGLPLNVARNNPSSSILVQLLPLAYYILAFVIPIAAVQEDVVVGDRAAWLTRPIAGGKLLAAKLLLVMLGLAIPAALISGVALLTLRAPLGWVGSAALLVGEMTILGNLGALAVGAFTKTLKQAMLVILGLFFSFLVFGLTLGASRPAQHLLTMIKLWPGAWAQHLSGGTEGFLHLAVAATTVLVVLVVLYRERRIARALVVLVVMVWAASGLVHYWPWDFMAPQPDASFVPLQDAELVAHGAIGAAYPADPDIAPAAPMRARTTFEGRVLLAMPVAIEGVPAACFLQLSTAGEIKLVLPDGRVVRGQGSPGSNTDPRSAMPAALGVAPTKTTRQVAEIQFSVAAEDFSLLAGQRVRVEAQIRAVPIGFRISHQFPLSPGQRFRVRGEVWQVQALTQQGNGPWTVLVDFAGLRDREKETDLSLKVVLALLNAGRNEVAFPQSGSPALAVMNAYEKWLCGVNVGELREEFRDCRARPTGQPRGAIDDDWLRGADLVVLTSTVGPRLDIPLVALGIEVPATARQDPAFIHIIRE